jgi:hypothetical protein
VLPHESLRLSLAAAVSAVLITGCGDHGRHATAPAAETASEFAHALATGDVDRAHALSAPPDDTAVDGAILDLQNAHVPARPLRTNLSHDCQPPIVAIGGTSLHGDCYEIQIGDGRSASVAQLQVWLTRTRQRVAGFALRTYKVRPAHPSRITIVKLFLSTKAEAEAAARDVRANGLGAKIEHALNGSWAVVLSGNRARVLAYYTRMKKRLGH